MSWYCIHAIFYTRFHEGPQMGLSVFETVYLVEAGSTSDARSLGMKIAESDAGDDTLVVSGRKATYTLAGLRKIIECQDFNERPNHGSELTYGEYFISDESELKLLVEGAEIRLQYVS